MPRCASSMTKSWGRAMGRGAGTESPATPRRKRSDEVSMSDSPNGVGVSIGDLRQYWPLARVHWRGWLTVGVCGVVSVALKLPMPLLTGYVIDRVLVGGQVRTLDLIFLVLVILSAFNIVLGYVSELALLRTQRDLCRRLSLQVLGHLQRTPMAYLSPLDSGYLQNRILTDATQLNNVVVTLFNIVMNSAMLLTGVVATVLLNLRLGVLSIALVPLFAVALRAFRRQIEASDYALKDQAATTCGVLTESLQARELTKLYSLGSANCRSLNRALLKELRFAVASLRYRFAATGIGSFLAALGPLLVVWYGGREVIAGRLTIGQLVAFSALLTFLYAPTSSLLGSQVALRRSLVSLRRIREILVVPSEPEPQCTSTPREFSLTFEHVSFAYERGVPVLKDVTLHIPEHSTIGIVGPVGSGKSTLVRLLVRMYSPSHGRIVLGGHDIAYICTTDLRRYIAVIPQEAFLFNGTVYHNIRLGLPGADRDQVIEAAVTAGAYDFVMRLPSGFDTPVGPNGMRLSGGQRQLVCMARAILRNPRVLLMDEPTSSVDPRTESIVRRSLSTIAKGRTTIIVAHRLSTVAFVDECIVLEAGRLVDQGTHRELMVRNKYYQDLASAVGSCQLTTEASVRTTPS